MMAVKRFMVAVEDDAGNVFILKSAGNVTGWNFEIAQPAEDVSDLFEHRAPVESPQSFILQMGAEMEPSGDTGIAYIIHTGLPFPGLLDVGDVGA